MPLVSVIVPLFNKGRTIGRTLSSILGQIHSPFEVIVIDDGSTDDGPAKVAALGDCRIRLFSQRNMGIGPTRNRGIALSNGRLIAFLDADDEWDPGFLAVAVNALNKHPECSVFVCNTVQGPARHKQWDHLRDEDFQEGPWRISPDASSRQAVKFFAGFSASSMVFRRETLTECGGFFPGDKCTFCEDLYLWIQVVLKHSIYRHMNPLAWYHREDSEIYRPERRERLPLEPTLTHADGLRRQCPAELHDLFERWLAERALDTAFLQMKGHHFEEARWLSENFPEMRLLKHRYAKLRLRMAFPRSWETFVEGRRVLRKTASSVAHAFQNADHKI